MSGESNRILVIADDFTGATDIAGSFVATGRNVILRISDEELLGEASKTRGSDANVEVYALNIRSTSPSNAVDAVARCLRAVGYDSRHDRIYFKYASTFDSTKAGNIGPILEFLANATGVGSCVVAPAFPDTGRTQYQGHLFVNGTLLDESPMKEHPLNPMRDSSVVRLLQEQTRVPCELVSLQDINGDPHQLERRLSSNEENPTFLVTDSITNEDLYRVARVVEKQRLVSGSAGLAQHYSRIGPESRVDVRPLKTSGRLILVGSQSRATKEQLGEWYKRYPHGSSIVMETGSSVESESRRLLDWLDRELGLHQEVSRPMLVIRPEVDNSHRNRDVPRAIEQVFENIARGASERGVTEYVVAGGETSAAVVRGLGVGSLQIGKEISAGVPWCRGSNRGQVEYNIALKSGNFGGRDFLTRAWEYLDD